MAEGEFRKWLSGFLPKRYAVTSGYIVSSGLRSKDKIPHFDVIIYDYLESPVLWIEDNPDSSEQGWSLAIPVEYVRAVLEVKSAFCTKPVKDAIEHLSDLRPLMQAIDQPSARYKLHLSPKFCCGVVFAELRRQDASRDLALRAMVNGGISLRGFFGGIVLRGEGHTAPVTGRIDLTQSEKAQDLKLDGKPEHLLEWGTTKTLELAEKVHIGATINWTEYFFAQFAFDLIAMIQGTYQPGRVSSFYGLGSSFLELKRESSPVPAE